jgi:predicted RNA-binding protein with PIN domain
MLYLIDGYNLLHALDVLPKRLGPKGLHYARQRLLDVLHAAFREDAGSVTIVFDAAGAPPSVRDVQEYRGLEVRFAVRHEEADDLIELLIRHEAHPQKLTVVSDDHRIQQAARRRHCNGLGCGAFLDWLHERRRPAPPATQADSSAKPQRSSDADTAHWLKEFADLQDSPEMKEAFNPFDFDE